MNFRVLLTNADSILLSMYQAFLVDQQMTIRTASTALQCLEVLRQWRPDVLVLDADLPWGSGLGVLAVMREDPTAPVVPVLLLAAEEDVADEANSIRDCVVLIKPVPTKVLADVIHLLANSARDDRDERPPAGQTSATSFSSGKRRTG